MSQDEFELNRSGQFSKRQTRLLLGWLVEGILTTTLPALLITVVFHNLIGVMIGTGIGIASAMFIWSGAMDLWEKRPISLLSQVRKERIRVRGPANYYIFMADKHDNQYQIRTPKEQWLEIQEGVTYKIFFTKRTKWLLSYKLLSPGDNR